jgi:4-hydroxybenzoate polyprenyltransferase
MRSAAITHYLSLLRIRHWVKNAFVFAPLVFSLRLFHLSALLKTLAVFAAFCLVSSSVYIFNDFVDRDRDRRHPQKRTRPLASGRISAANGSVAGFALLALSAWISAASGPGVQMALAGYFGLNIAYSLLLKRFVILDVMMIAFGFLFRVVAGAIAIDVPLSQWMLLNTFFLALFLGFCKRRKELVLDEGYARHRPVLERYSVSLLDHLLLVSVTLTIITYSLYVLDARVVQRLGTGDLIVTIPLVVFGLFRYLYLVYRREKGEDPVEAILADPAIAVDIALWGAVSIGILYLSKGGILS